MRKARLEPSDKSCKVRVHSEIAFVSSRVFSPIFNLERIETGEYLIADTREPLKTSVFYIDPVSVDDIDLLTIEELYIIAEELSQAVLPTPQSQEEAFRKESLKRILNKMTKRIGKEF